MVCIYSRLSQSISADRWLTQIIVGVAGGFTRTNSDAAFAGCMSTDLSSKRCMVILFFSDDGYNGKVTIFHAA